MKDPLFLAKAVREWHDREGVSVPVHLCIVGPVLHAETGAAVMAACASASEVPVGGSGPRASDVCCATAGDTDDGFLPQTTTGDCPSLPSPILYHPPVDQATVWVWMRQADVTLNTSISEGQSAAVLEAMALGCIVVARRNEGNAAVIVNGVNGWLFDTPEQAVAACKEAICVGTGSGETGLDCVGNRRTAAGHRVAAAARAYCETHHSLEAEVEAWRRLLASLSPTLVPGLALSGGDSEHRHDHHDHHEHDDDTTPASPVSGASASHCASAAAALRVPSAASLSS